MFLFYSSWHYCINSINLVGGASKKKVIQQNDHDTLSKKLLLLPILFIILIFSNGTLGYLLRELISALLRLIGIDYIGSWAALGGEVSFGIASYFQGVSYPIVLLIFSTELRKKWKKLFVLKKKNKIHPVISNAVENVRVIDM